MCRFLLSLEWVVSAEFCNAAMLHQEQGEAMEAEKIYCHACGLDRLDRLDPLDPACQ